MHTVSRSLARVYIQNEERTERLRELLVKAGLPEKLYRYSVSEGIDLSHSIRSLNRLLDCTTALGHKRKSSVGLGMSGFGGGAEVDFWSLEVCL